jgi:hypothetical protein
MLASRLCSASDPVSALILTPADTNKGLAALTYARRGGTAQMTATVSHAFTRS